MFKGLNASHSIYSTLGSIFASYIRFVYRTSKISFLPGDVDACLISNTPIIMSMWHGQFMMLPNLRVDAKNTKVKAMVARHTDAELIGQALLRFDIDLVRGAGAGDRKKDRGGATALRSSLSALEKGYSIIMTADVPPGPARVAGHGIITMAKLSGRPIIPVASATSRYWALNTWSRFTINMPFSKMTYIFGEPIYVAQDSDEAEMEKQRKNLERAMNDITEQAYKEVGSDAVSMTPSHMLPDDFQLKRNLSLNLYKSLTSMARPLLPYILKRRAQKGKEDLSRKNERMGIACIERPHGKLTWFHAASVGEMNVILPIMHLLNQKYPDLKLLLTTGTVTSANLAENRMPVSTIHQYVPLDASQYVENFLRHWQPDVAFFTESEIWPNLLMETGKRQIPLILLNGTMSEKSFRRWRKRANSARILFSQFRMILCQNNKLSKRFTRLGARKAHSVGNLKIDAPLLPVNHLELNKLKNALKNRKVFLAASTHEGEDEIIIRAHKQISKTIPELITIIIPRHPHRGEDIENLVKDFDLTPMRRSLNADLDNIKDIYIADTIGEMGTFYSLTSLAFIGGSLIPHGGQNPIEALRLNTAILSGKHTHNFKDTYTELQKHEAIKVLDTAEEISQTVISLLNDETQLEQMNLKGQEALNNLSGAFDKTIDLIAPYLPIEDNGMRQDSVA